MQKNIYYNVNKLMLLSKQCLNLQSAT